MKGPIDFSGLLALELLLRSTNENPARELREPPPLEFGPPSQFLLELQPHGKARTCRGSLCAAIRSRVHGELVGLVDHPRAGEM